MKIFVYILESSAVRIACHIMVLYVYFPNSVMTSYFFDIGDEFTPECWFNNSQSETRDQRSLACSTSSSQNVDLLVSTELETINKLLQCNNML